MEQNKSIPGTKQYKAIIAGLRKEMKETIEKIKEYERKIEETKKIDEENSPKRPLDEKREELDSALKELQASKRENYNKLNEIKSVYGDLGGRSNDSKNAMSTEAIDKRLKEINLELLKYPCTSQRSKEVEDEIKNLKLKKKNIETEQKKTEIEKKARERYFELNSAIRSLKDEISEKNAELKEVKATILEMESQTKPKNPVIEAFEKSIEVLSQKKEEFYKKILFNQEEIAKKIEKHNAYLAQKAILESHEKEKKEINERIKGYETQKEALLVEQGECDSTKFDSVIFALNNVKSREGEKASFPIDIVLSLTQFKVKIPSLISQIDDTIRELEVKRIEFLGTVGMRLKELDKKVSEVEELISKEKYLLAEVNDQLKVKLPTFDTMKQYGN